jgi:hypothetical protein
LQKANFHATKKGGTKPNPKKNSFVQLSKKLEKLEKVIKKQGAKSKKCHRDNSNSNSELGTGLSSIGKLAINLGETVKKTKFTPPSLIKASPTLIASNQDDISPTSFSMITSQAKMRGYILSTVLPLTKTHQRVKPLQ